MPRHAPPDDEAALVFYVEDQRSNVALMQTLFVRRPPWRLVAASSGKQAWKLSARLTPTLLLLDQRLADCSGAKLLSLLRRRPGWAGVPAVVLTADEAMPTPADFRETWAKPLDWSFVLSRLDVLLAPATANLRAPERLRRNEGLPVQATL